MLVNSNSSEYIFRVLGTTKERGFYSSTEDLREIIEIKFSNTVACVGNPRLRVEAGAVEVLAPFSMVMSPRCLGYYTLSPGEELSQGRGRCGGVSQAQATRGPARPWPPPGRRGCSRSLAPPGRPAAPSCGAARQLQCEVRGEINTTIQHLPHCPSLHSLQSGYHLTSSTINPLYY